LSYLWKRRHSTVFLSFSPFIRTELPCSHDMAEATDEQWFS